MLKFIYERILWPIPTTIDYIFTRYSRETYVVLGISSGLATLLSLILRYLYPMKYSWNYVIWAGYVPGLAWAIFNRTRRYITKRDYSEFEIWTGFVVESFCLSTIILGIIFLPV